MDIYYLRVMVKKLQEFYFFKKKKLIFQKKNIFSKKVITIADKNPKKPGLATLDAIFIVQVGQVPRKAKTTPGPKPIPKKVVIFLKKLFFLI